MDAEKDVSVRLSLMNQINAVLANIEAAEQRVHKARSEMGTAEAELKKLQQSYSDLRGRLLTSLPTTDIPNYVRPTITEITSQVGFQIGQ